MNRIESFSDVEAVSPLPQGMDRQLTDAYEDAVTKMIRDGSASEAEGDHQARALAKLSKITLSMAQALPQTEVRTLSGLPYLAVEDRPDTIGQLLVMPLPQETAQRAGTRPVLAGTPEAIQATLQERFGVDPSLTQSMAA